MTVRIAAPARNLREELAALRADIKAATQQQFWFTGTGSLTAFVMTSGWKPLHVFLAGALQKEGSGNQYTVSFDGFLYTITFAAAPAGSAAIGVIGVRA
jgi:hypothetical protein